MVVISQIWVQHLQCTQIIGHCHLRAGSALDPDLAANLYSAMIIVLADVEQEFQYTMSGVYGYRIPDLEGIGLFTVADKYYRIFFLCEGLYKKGIPYLAGKKISKKINQLFAQLSKKTDSVSCKLTHRLESGSYWFDLLCSIGFGGEIEVDTIREIYPLYNVAIHTKSHLSSDNLNIFRLESSILGSLGYGFKDRDRIFETKIEGIFREPQRSFEVYSTLFKQIREISPTFEPNTLILTYHPTNRPRTANALIAILSLNIETLNIRYCIPVTPGFGIDGTTTDAYLRTLYLESLELIG
ncbi:MAG: hypothetical protein ACXAB7_21280 [Candidatus Kariarchaeaceae archaeon]